MKHAKQNLKKRNLNVQSLKGPDFKDPIVAEGRALKRQNLPAGLWVVATPIGNLEDMTPRALGALFGADKILCEDTRRAAALLGALCQKGEEMGKSVNREYMKRLFRLDAHTSDRASLAKWMACLREGESLALISDAGTPGVSDPGAELVSWCREEGVPVLPLPGPSAVTAFLSASGLIGTQFAFRGFFPRDGGVRKQEVQRVLSSGDGCIEIYFESPGRLISAFEFWSETAGSLAASVKCSAVKELTKIHERFFFGTLIEVLDQLKVEIAKEGERGEWCFAVQYSPVRVRGLVGEGEVGKDGEPGWKKALKCLLSCGVSVSDAVAEVKVVYEVPKKQCYDEALRIRSEK